MWRLMATILVVSDTGSVSLDTSHTDWPSEQQCRQIIASHYQSPPPREFNGHTIAAMVSASCVPVNPPVMASSERSTYVPRPPPGSIPFPFPFFAR